MCGTGKCGATGCVVNMVVKVLLIIGGLNWGLVGAGMLAGAGNDWNVVNMVLGGAPAVEAVVYLLVGVAAVIKIFGCCCAKCKAACAACVPGGSQVSGGGEKSM